MAKAILELEMPESCVWCPCVTHDMQCDALFLLKQQIALCPDEGRRPDCPLRLADELCQKAERTLDDKCRGYQVSRWDDEPIEKCKNCKDFELYEEVEQDA